MRSRARKGQRKDKKEKVRERMRRISQKEKEKLEGEWTRSEESRMIRELREEDSKQDSTPLAGVVITSLFRLLRT